MKNALIFILITIALDAIGLGIIIPSLPNLIADVANVTLIESAKYMGIITGIYALMQFVFSPLIGNLSDRYGRRPLLLISLLGLGLDYVFMYFAPSLEWLIVGRVIAGICGASFTTAAAYIADISTDENRAQNFGLIGAAFGVGFIVGPAIGGLVAGFGLKAPFLVAAFCSLINFIYGLVILKESLPKENRRKFEWKRANPVGALLQLKKFDKSKHLFTVLFLVMLCNMAVHGCWNYYTMSKFGWTPEDVGISLAVVGVCFGIVQGGLSGVIVKKIGEKATAKIGIIILAITTAGIGLLPYGWMLYVIMLPYAFGGIIDPAIRSIVSSKTADNEHGEVQGIFTSIMSVAEMVGPPLMLYLYYNSAPLAKVNVAFYGTPFFFGALLAIIGLIFLYRAFKKE